MFTTTMKRLSSLGGLALLVGCATTGSTKATGPESADPESSGTSAPTDIFKAKPQEARVSEDQREDFEKAVAIYQKLKRNSAVLKGGDCDEAASAFRRVADENPTMLIA